MNRLAELEASLTQTIVNSFLSDGRCADFDSRTNLLGLLDSLQLLRLIVQVESKVGVKVQDGELTPENLGTVERMAAFLDGKLQDLRGVELEALGAG